MYLKYKYIKFILNIALLYLLFFIFIRLINIYTSIFILVLFFFLYKRNKNLFKKLLYKLLNKKKKDRLSFRSKYDAANTSLKGIENIYSQINDKVEARLIKYQQEKLKSGNLPTKYSRDVWLLKL